MDIHLDPQGAPHWLSELRKKPRRVLRLILGKGRQLRLKIRDRPRRLRIVK